MFNKNCSLNRTCLLNHGISLHLLIKDRPDEVRSKIFFHVPVFIEVPAFDKHNDNRKINIKHFIESVINFSSKKNRRPPTFQPQVKTNFDVEFESIGSKSESERYQNQNVRVLECAKMK